jgi:hypothetical protein
MMNVYDEWRDRMQERSRQRMVKRTRVPECDETEETLRCLETLREWGIIDEDEFQGRRLALVGIRVPAGKAW